MIFEVYNTGEFVYTPTGGYAIDISGFTTDATHTILMQAASGQGINNSGLSATQLAYNPTNGVAVRNLSSYAYCIRIGQDYTTIRGLQFTSVSVAGSGHGSGVYVNGGFANARIDQCLFECSDSFAFVYAGLLTRSAFIGTTQDPNQGFSSHYCNPLSIIGCTIVNPSDESNSNVAFDNASCNGATFKDNAVFGFGGGVMTTATNVTSSYNGTDQSSCPGSNNQTSLTYTSQFVNTLYATADFRTKTGSSLRGAGVADATYNPTDVYGQTRNTPPDIGAWEYVSASGGSNTNFLQMFP